MRVYKFIFIVGLLNLIVPFLGVPTMYKNYVGITLAIITLGYALIVRAVEKEKKSHTAQSSYANIPPYKEPTAPVLIKTIEDVVEMVEVEERVVVSDVTPKRRGRKPKILVQEENYE